MSDPSIDIFRSYDDSIECVVDSSEWSFGRFPASVRVDNGNEIESYVPERKYDSVVDIAKDLFDSLFRVVTKFDKIEPEYVDDMYDKLLNIGVEVSK